MILAALFFAAVGVCAQTPVEPPPTVVEREDTLQTSYVTAVKEKMRNTTQTGLMRLDGDKLRSSVAAFGTPDIIKSLQMLPGVAAGNELMSGLYVHGGDGNDNLFLLDGVPLYNVSHFGGFFSSFNTDVVDNLDFYKSGFPARYGGRLSSVVDVETSEGDMQAWHGGASIGLIDGRLHAEGPLWKDRTSVNFGLRRSWLDVITTPAIAYANRRNGDGTTARGGYAMWDFNGRITHKINDANKLNATIYWGKDRLRAGLLEDTGSYMDIGMRSIWGTLAGALSWESSYSSRLRGKLLLYYTRSDSDVGYTFEVGGTGPQGAASTMYFNDDNICAVHDGGLKYDFDWYPNSFHHVRFGASVSTHYYKNAREYEQRSSFPGTEPETSKGDDGDRYSSAEPAIYIEDEFFISYNFTLNAGLRASAFGTGLKTWASVEPRAALKWMLNRNVCTKLSYTRMKQYAHLVSAMYIDLPTNSWMPSIPGAEPMVSDQFAGGIYITPGRFKFNVEGWYKTMDGILAYNGANAFYPPLVNWEKSFTSGKGESYGLELEASYASPRIDLSAYYTLSWSLREFEAYSMFTFPDRNDNRHKVNIVGTWRPGKHLSIFFNWNYHTGNRITLPSHVIQLEGGSTEFLYQSPYNAKLPDYHRLDLGVDYCMSTAAGRKVNINLSIYNAYNHLNASFAMLETDRKGNYTGMAYGLVPIIPTLSIAYKF